MPCTCLVQSHPIPDTNNAASVQIILPQKQIGRRSDMYVFCCSFAHNVAATNKWLAFVSTTVETANPEAELAPGLALLGPVDEKFVEVRDVYEPIADRPRSVTSIQLMYEAYVYILGATAVSSTTVIPSQCFCQASYANQPLQMLH